jgi:hypothetical protein
VERKNKTEREGRHTWRRWRVGGEKAREGEWREQEVKEERERARAPEEKSASARGEAAECVREKVDEC